MRILFVYPSALTYGKQKIRSSFLDKLISGYMSPPFLDFQSLSSVTPKKHSFNFVSEEYNEINFDEEYDLVGITSGTQNALRAYEIADEFRRKGGKVVLGGWHISALPVEAIQHADSVVIGEAEETWPKLLEDLENDKLKSYYRQEKPVDLSKIPLKKIDIMKKTWFHYFRSSYTGLPFQM